MVNDEPSSEQPPNDPKQEGAKSQDKDESSAKKDDKTTIDIDGEDEISDAESVHEIFDRITWDTLDPLGASDIRPLQERIKKGPKRAVQQMEYTRLIEDRMIDMEKRLRLIENKGLEPELPGKMNQPLDLILGIKRMTFQEYLPIDPNPGLKVTDATFRHKRRHEFPGQLPYHLIDVIVSGSNQAEQLGKDQFTKLAADLLDPAASDPAIPNQDLKINDLHSVQPERIRINSTLLLYVLQKITGMAFKKARVGDKLELRDQVILRPFKLFVTFDQEIRAEIYRLEKIHMRNGNENKPEAPETAKTEDQTPPPPPVTDVLDNVPGHSSREHSDDPKCNKSQNPTMKTLVGGQHEGIHPLESRRCLEELLVLRELLDKDLEPMFDLRRQIKDGSARSIAFQDLWHLFPLGTEIVSNGSNGQHQTYRILSVSGGKPFLCKRWTAGMDRLNSESTGEELPVFEILSYFYDFDGKELGARQQLHTVKWYDGDKMITSLPCYPINYSKTSGGLNPRDFFIKRGKRFLDLTRQADVVHKRYDGLTLAMDGLREEVRQTLNTMQNIY